MKYTFGIFIMVSIIFAALLTEKMFWELDLKTGIAKTQYSMLGVVFQKYTNIHNPSIRPNWTGNSSNPENNNYQ